MRKYTGLIVVLALSGILLTGCATQLEKGTDLLAEEKYEQAAKVFEKATKKESRQAEAYRGLGISYFELKKYENAREAFEKAIEFGAKETAQLDNMLGISCMKTEKYKEAATYFEKGGKHSDASEELKKEMAFNEIYMLEKSGDNKKAKEKADAYLKSWPDDEKVKKEAEFLETQAGND
nr:tetratricopeptide repeat protein [uncultured Sellimonas sp.]